MVTCLNPESCMIDSPAVGAASGSAPCGARTRTGGTVRLLCSRRLGARRHALCEMGKNDAKKNKSSHKVGGKPKKTKAEKEAELEAFFAQMLARASRRTRRTLRS